MNSRAFTRKSDSSRIWLGVALLVMAIAIGFVGRIGRLENQVYDYFQRYQYKQASDRIVLVSVDSRNEALKDIWSGQQFGKLAAALDELGARLVIATEPLHLPDVPTEEQIGALEELQKQARLVASLNEQEDPLAGQVAEFRRRYDERRELADDFAGANNILLSAHVASFALESAPVDACALHAVNTNATEAVSLRGLQRIRHIAVPPEIICDSIYGIGFSNFWPDPDGVIRHAELVINANDTFLPSLALSANTALAGKNKDIVIAATDALMVTDQIIQTGADLQILNRYYAGSFDAPAFHEVNAASVLAGRADRAIFRDKIVLVGESDESATAGLLTPVDANMSPLRLIATSLSNLIENDYLLRPEWLPFLETGVLTSIIVVALFWIPTMPAIGAALMGIVLAMLVISIEAWFLVAEGIWVQLATASVFIALAVWTIQIWKLLAARGKNQSQGRSSYAHIANEGDKLDMEFSVLRQQAPTEDTKEKLYDIAMLHGKAREYARAERVLQHIANLDPQYRDVKALLTRLSGARKKKPVRRRNPALAGGLDRARLGRYEIDRVLGRGAMATVYLGRDPAINRKVAIKTVALAKEFDEAELKDAKLQFKREAESAGRLNHPNIIAIYDAGDDDDVSYLAMEYFEGVSLLEHVQPDNLMPPKWVLELCARAAEALDYAHRQNVVHRDIKPANLMYHAATDTLKLTDFGIARLTDSSRTKTGIILGTPSYMSPEQLSASGVTGQSDLYSLGVTMYQLLTGTAPFRADSIPKLMDKILHEAHTPLHELRNDLPDCVEKIIDKAMAKIPADRYANGREMAMALRECAKNFAS